MLHRRRAPLFAGLAVLVSLAGPAGAQTALSPTPAAPVPTPVPAVPTPAPAPAAAPAAGTVFPSTAPTANSAADSFAVTGVKVDVNAANANEARDRAIREAQSKAWADLYKRLVPGGTAPRLSETELAKLVQGFEIDDEKASATRYIGSITVRFRPAAVREALGGSSSAQYVEPPAKPFVVLPVTVTDGKPVLWQDRTPWRAAWEERPATSSLVPLVVPDGELADVQAISAEDALAGNNDALARIAQRYNAGGVIVVRTEMPAAGPDLGKPLSVEVTRFTPDGTREAQTVSVKPDASDRPNDFLGRAVTFVGTALDESWRRNNVVATGPEQSTLVRVPLTRIEDWVETRKRLTGVTGLTRTDVVSLSRTEAVVSLTHRGAPDQLRQAMNRRDLSLSRGPVPAALPVAGAPPMPAAEWQLTLLQGAGSGPVPTSSATGAVGPAPTAAPMAVPAPMAPAVPPATSGPFSPTPIPAPSSGMGTPPRNLGTLPAGQ